jgi:hypothetical protein
VNRLPDVRRLALFDIEEGKREMIRLVIELRDPRRLNQLDAMLDAMDVTEFHPRVLVALVTSAGTVKQHLPHWDGFADRVREFFARSQGQEWADDQLRGIV